MELGAKGKPQENGDWKMEDGEWRMESIFHFPSSIFRCALDDGGGNRTDGTTGLESVVVVTGAKKEAAVGRGERAGRCDQALQREVLRTLFTQAEVYR